ncbi:MAG: peptidoglycan-binding protein [Candidatus Omnitrophota bacterium]
MVRKEAVYGILLLFVVSAVISGCETVPKHFKEEVGGIKTRVETLESKVDGMEAKQAEAERLSAEASQALEQREETNISPRSKSKERVREIQACLKSAGFYTGTIDGISGKNTRHAIREFQKANGLNPDGIVGKKTWELLSKYGGSSEGPTK